MGRINYLKLTIPKPCSAKWEDMAPSEKGRLCESCHKHVSDFTSFSDEQLKNFFNTSNTNSCGRLTSAQLNRVLTDESKNTALRFIPQLLISAALSIGLIDKANAKTNPISVIQLPSYIAKQRGAEEIKNPVASTDSINCVKGRIIDSLDNEPLPSTSISIKGTVYQTASDINGEFKLPIPDKLIGKNLILVFSFIGYETKEIQVSAKSTPDKLEVQLNQSKSLGEVVLVGAIRRETLWSRVRRIFKND